MPPQTVGTVLCCKCGILMQPNKANMCANCLRSEVNITEGLQKHVNIIHCPNCQSYLKPPTIWVKAELESSQLLRFCLKRLNLKKVHVTHAEFIWTEPHSKRVKVALRVQKEVLNGVILEQAYVVEYVVEDRLCDSCSRFQANPDQWVASVQLRQNVHHKRTLHFLEQILLKHDAAARSLRITSVERGLDVLFRNRSHAVKFVEFVHMFTPARAELSKQLVSHDGKSNTHNYKYKFCVEIPPVCREDLICLPRKVSVSLGNLGPLVICTKVTKNIALLDPFTLRSCFLDADKYWRSEFKSLCSAKQLTEYMVLDVEPNSSEIMFGRSMYVSADVQVARVSDFRTVFYVRTHLGHLLKVGDHVLGYDLRGANCNDTELEKYNHLDIPEVILVKKMFPKNLNSVRSNGEKKNAESVQSLRDLDENFKTILNLCGEDNQPSEMASIVDRDDVIANLFENFLDINEEEINDMECEGDYMSE